MLTGFVATLDSFPRHDNRCMFYSTLDQCVKEPWILLPLIVSQGMSVDECVIQPWIGHERVRDFVVAHWDASRWVNFVSSIGSKLG
jgi:hypothetical protein